MRRALKTRGNTPKYGLIFHSSFIGRAKQRNKGRISRYLANKCSIASRCAPLHCARAVLCMHDRALYVPQNLPMKAVVSTACSASCESLVWPSVSIPGWCCETHKGLLQGRPLYVMRLLSGADGWERCYMQNPAKEGVI
jgi:hypothetical protein